MHFYLHFFLYKALYMEKYKFARKFCQNSVYIIVITNKYEGAKNLWNKDGGGKEENMSEGLLKIFIKDYSRLLLHRNSVQRIIKM